MHTILVLGGYGFFGGRICQALATNENIHLLIGGRNVGKTQALAKKLGIKSDQGIRSPACRIGRICTMPWTVQLYGRDASIWQSPCRF